MRKIIALYDYSAEGVLPWAEAGYECFTFDIQHDKEGSGFEYGKGRVWQLNMDLHQEASFQKIKQHIEKVDFLMAYPVCTYLAVVGNSHYESRIEQDPLVLARNVNYAIWCAELGDYYGCPYFVENPKSRLSTLWRKPDYTFHPYEYGGYLEPHEGRHPTYPDFIEHFDAYPKKTCLWTNEKFIMPPKLPVVCGEYKQAVKLGGKSTRTKNIKSTTPRGFARAVYQYNHDRRKHT